LEVAIIVYYSRIVVTPSEKTRSGFSIDHWFPQGPPATVDSRHWSLIRVFRDRSIHIPSVRKNWVHPITWFLVIPTYNTLLSALYIIFLNIVCVTRGWAVINYARNSQFFNNSCISRNNLTISVHPVCVNARGTWWYMVGTIIKRAVRPRLNCNYIYYKLLWSLCTRVVKQIPNVVRSIKRRKLSSGIALVVSLL